MKIDTVEVPVQISKKSREAFEGMANALNCASVAMDEFAKIARSLEVDEE